MAFEPVTGNSISKKGRVHETGLDGYVSVNNGKMEYLHAIQPRMQGSKSLKNM